MRIKNPLRRRARRKTPSGTGATSSSSSWNGCLFLDFGGGDSCGETGGCLDGCDGCGGGCDLTLMTLTTLLLAGGALRRLPKDEAARHPGARGFLWRRIRAYQTYVSPRTPARCRMTPTCSAYAAEAVTRHGNLHGVTLTARRIRTCRPGGPTGHQPVPDGPH
jgi:putative membrane protein insertion efficiency factor